MRDTVHSSQIYPALQALLGLPDHCVSFELRVSSGQPGVTVTCEHYLALDAPGLKQLESVFSEYELVRKNPTPAFSFHAEDSAEFQAAKAKVMGFDAWMRERTDRAHAEYMAGHAAGGIDYSKRHARGGLVDGIRLVGEAV